MICATMWSVTFTGRATAVSDYAVQVSVSVQTNPAQIMLVWPADPNASSYTVYRKTLGANSWGGGVATLASTVAGFADKNVTVGSNYEYRISKAASGYYGEGYVYAGIQMPLIGSRGKVILLVDRTFSTNLATELARLQADLVGDGWTVLRHDIPRMAVDPANTNSNVWWARSNEMSVAKAIVRSDYLADPTNLASVFLFGHLPVPYSGNIAPDGHVPQHSGAWPADGYYGDVPYDIYFWRDSLFDVSSADDQRNWNVPGDGKFDQSVFPIPLALQVGRVDLANLPTFSQGETELLRQYLNKDHAFRQKLITAQRRGWIDDNFGLSTGEPFAVAGWRDFAAFFGASNTVAGSDWFGSLATNSYLWGFGCGPGTFTSCGGVGSSADFAANDPRVVFTMFFGSYFGDWDSQDNFLRAALATPNYTLSSVWSGRPYWQFHHMGLGQTIGYGTLVSQNNLGAGQGGYDFNTDNGFVHIALMGDPTLRMHIVAPPSALIVSNNGSGGANLSWNASPDTVLGYHVYRAPTSAGPFTRLTTNLLTGLNYTDPIANTNVYMVRTVKLEVSGSGSYYNASQGIFQNLDGSAGAPSITLFQPTNSANFGVLPIIKFCADTFDPANCVTNVTFYANGIQIGETNEPPYSMQWSNVPAGSYVLTARATYSGGLATNSPAVNVQVAYGAMENTTTVLARTTGTSTQTYGGPLTFTATVTGIATTPGGSVVFKDGSTTLTTISLVAGTAPNATATYTASTDLGVNGSTHAVAAYYQGDATHDPSDSSAGALVQTITAKPINYAGISAADKVYDATTSVTLSGVAMALPAESPGSGSISDGAPYIGDAVSFATGTLAGAFADANVANTKPVTVTSGVTLAPGGQSANYSVGQPVANIIAAITALPVTLSGSRNYDGTATAASAILTVGNNLDGGNLTLVGSATLALANGGLQNLSSFAGLGLGGTAAPNYTFVGASGSVRINPAPGPFAIATFTNQPATFAASNLIASASDAGVALSVSAVATVSAQGGTALLNGDHTITYAPATNYAGADSFNYTLSDDGGGSSHGLVTVQVNPGSVFSLITNYVVNSDGSFSFAASGLPYEFYSVLAANTASGPWISIGTATALGNSVVRYTDTDATNHASRVYRLAQP
ncbi:MAG: YDG domain-containing protein [Formivibrio sp.]|nr:YDG domain-containing protein [Formivibrio sp.]